MTSSTSSRSPWGALLQTSFFARDALDVAPELLGAVLVLGEVVLRVTETEAYRSGGDTANHCRAGVTARNAPMWGPPGRAYVYLCYGLHHMLNLVTGTEGVGEAVLIRSAEPLAGLPCIRARRRGLDGPSLLTGPGKVAQALALDRSWNGHAVTHRGGLEASRGEPPAAIAVGPRVGVDYASPVDRGALWRFAIADSPWVTSRRTLTRIRGSGAR